MKSALSEFDQDSDGDDSSVDSEGGAGRSSFDRGGRGSEGGGWFVEDDEDSLGEGRF